MAAKYCLSFVRPELFDENELVRESHQVSGKTRALTYLCTSVHESLLI